MYVYAILAMIVTKKLKIKQMWMCVNLSKFHFLPLFPNSKPTQGVYLGVLYNLPSKIL